MRVWHNLSYDLDIIECIENMAYGVREYPIKKDEPDSGRWFAKWMSLDEIQDYIDWCDMYCNKVTYNAWLKKDTDDDWL